MCEHVSICEMMAMEEQQQHRIGLLLSVCVCVVGAHVDDDVHHAGHRALSARHALALSAQQMFKLVYWLINVDHVYYIHSIYIYYTCKMLCKRTQRTTRKPL